MEIVFGPAGAIESDTTLREVTQRGNICLTEPLHFKGRQVQHLIDGLTGLGRDCTIFVRPTQAPAGMSATLQRWDLPNRSSRLFTGSQIPFFGLAKFLSRNQRRWALTLTPSETGNRTGEVVRLHGHARNGHPTRIDAGFLALCLAHHIQLPSGERRAAAG